MSPLVLFVLLVAVVEGVQPPPFEDRCIVGIEDHWPQRRPVPSFEINLDLPPYERWQAVTGQYKQEIKGVLQVIKSLLLPLFHGKAVHFIDKYMGGWQDKIRQPYKDEIAGIANATGITMGEMVLYNLFYEIHSFCTSVVAKDVNGKMYHGRNMDFGMLMGWNTTTHMWTLTQHLRTVTADIKLMKGGKVFANEVTFIGFVGIFNGMKKDAFTLTMNTRFDMKNGGLLHIVQWLFGLTPDNMEFTTFHARTVLETCNTYEEAKLSLMNTPLMAPCYYIIAGVSQQGAIIARDPTKTVDVVDLGSVGHEWYILQTNYDPKKTPLYLDDRRTPGHKCMQQLGQSNLTLSGLYNVLSSKTTLNKETVLTVMMQPHAGTFATFERECPDPCWPW